MAGSWTGLEMQLASPGIWREDKHPDIRHESWTVRPGGAHEQCKQELYPDSGVTTRLGTQCSYRPPSGEESHLRVLTQTCNLSVLNSEMPGQAVHCSQ